MAKPAPHIEKAADATVSPVPENCHPKIRAIVDYWRSIHPKSGGLPGRQHFDPTDVPNLLANIWLIDAVREPLRFRLRLIGTLVVDYAGEDNTGRWLHERWPAFDDSAYVQVVETRQPSWSRGPSRLRPEKEFYEIERVRLPLASDGETVDLILALTVFFDRRGDEIFRS